jgi:hypothetical protein
MDLCFSCQRFDIRRLARSPGGKGRYWLKLAQDGARSGCSFCTILVNTIFERVSEVCDEEKMWIHFEAMKSRQSATGSNQNSGSLDIDRLRVFIAPETYLIDDEEVVEKSLTELHVCADQGMLKRLQCGVRI